MTSLLPNTSWLCVRRDAPHKVRETPVEWRCSRLAPDSQADSHEPQPKKPSQLWIEDPLTVRYSEAWLELKCSTRVPLLAGEKVELVDVGDHLKT